jgi:hypothetical protein
MKSINTDVWLVNFILHFSGLSPILIGPKVNFFKLMWRRRPQQCEHLLNSTQPKQAWPNQLSSKKATIWPNKIFFGLYEQRQPTRIVLGSTQLQTGQIRFMMHTFCHNWHVTRARIRSPFDGEINSPKKTRHSNTIDNVKAKIDNVKAKIQDEERRSWSRPTLARHSVFGQLVASSTSFPLEEPPRQVSTSHDKSPPRWRTDVANQRGAEWMVADKNSIQEFGLWTRFHSCTSTTFSCQAHVATKMLLDLGTRPNQQPHDTRSRNTHDTTAGT